MKRTNNSILGKYSDGSYRSKRAPDTPLMASYEQRYKGSLTRMTEPVSPMTLDEKIAARDKEESPKSKPMRVSVEIGGVNYLLGASDDISPAKIKKIAELADKVYSEIKENNPYIATNKTAILSLIEMCDRYISLKTENDTLKTELMYFRQKDLINSAKDETVELTPMEKLAGGQEPPKLPHSNVAGLMKEVKKQDEQQQN